MKMTNETYDALKKISLLIVPFVTFLAAVTDIWQMPYGTAICATVSAFGVFLGAALDISSKNYHASEDEDDV